MRDSKNIGIFIILLIFILADNFGFIFNLDKEIYNRQAQFEYNHLYPQEHFKDAQEEIDSVTLRLRNYEHIRWLHSKSHYDEDWEKVKNNVPLMFKIFGGADAQLVEDGDIRLYAKRNAAMIAGSNVISYQWLVFNYKTKNISLPKPLFAMNFDGVSNLLYNITYITSIPYKFIHFSILCFNSIQDFGVLESLKLFIWMLIQLLFGFYSAIIMLIVGPVVGLICHPLETLGNLTFSLKSPTMNNLIVTIFDLIISIVKPLIRIF